MQVSSLMKQGLYLFHKIAICQMRVSTGLLMHESIKSHVYKKAHGLA